MFTIDVWWTWLIRAAVLSSVVLTVGLIALRGVRRPVERVRLINWIMAVCLIAPWLPVSTSWSTIRVDLDSWLEPAAGAADPAADHTRLPPAESRSVDTRSSQAPAPATADRDTERVIPDGTESVPASTVFSPATQHSAAPQHSVGRSFDGRTLIVTGWLLVLGTMSVWVLAGCWLRYSLQRRARPPSPALSCAFDSIAGAAGSHVRLIVSEGIDSPVTWGIRRPVIVIPHKFENESTESELRWSLAHEWSHVKRKDAAALWLAVAVQFVCFYQPLYWVLRRRLFLCQDYIADADAARHSSSAEDYADFLIRLARSRLRPATLTLGISDNRSQLSQRIRMLVSSGSDMLSGCRKHFNVLTAGGAAICLLLLTTIQLNAARDPATSLDAASPASGIVTGVLINAETGQPVANARVLLRASGVARTRSDADGRFRFEDVESQETGCELLALKENLVSGWIPVPRSFSDADALVASTHLRLTMHTGKRVRFVIKSDDTGQPIPKAIVSFAYPDRRNMASDRAGTVTVNGLNPQEYTVTVEAEGYAGESLRVNLDQAEELSEVAVRLAPGGDVQGLVTDEQGRPVSDAQITWQVKGHSGSFGAAERTDVEGKFQHRFLPLNVPVAISVRKKGYAATQQDVSLSTNTRSREVRITLSPRHAGGSITGVVQDGEGRPVAGILIANYGNQSSQERRTTTDDHGRFELHGLFDGLTGPTVCVSGKGFAPQRISVEPGSREIPAEMTITLEPGRSLQGRVVNEEGEAVSGAHVMARSEAFQMGLLGFEAARTDVEGVFRFDSLPADVRFQVSHPDFAMTPLTSLPVEETQPATITLPDPGIIRGQVFDEETTEPVRQFRVRVGFSRVGRQPDDATGSWDHDWQDPGLTFSSDDGQFNIGPLTARMPLELIIEAEGYERMIVPRAVAVRSKDAENLAISLIPESTSAPYSLAVQILDHDGNPVPNVELRLIVSPDQPAGSDDNRFNWALIESHSLAQKSWVDQFLSGVTGADGTYEFTTILPNRYLQLVYWGDGVPKSRDLAFGETISGESDAVVIDVEQPAILRGSMDRSQFPDADSIHVSDPTRSFPNVRIQLADDQSTFEVHDLPAIPVTVSVLSKPIPYTQNGAQYFRPSLLARQRIALTSAEATDVQFDSPDSAP